MILKSYEINYYNLIKKVFINMQYYFKIKLNFAPPNNN